jgi:hypothetical protein
VYRVPILDISNSMNNPAKYTPRIRSGLLGMLLFASVTLSGPGTARADELQGQFYDIGGYRLYMTCMGEGRTDGGV